MRIAELDVFVLKHALETPFAFSQGWVTQRAATLVRLRADSGAEGWGEAFAQGLEPPEIAAAAIEHALKPLVIGADALAPSPLWHAMYARTRDFGRKGSVVAAISAVDIAMWDLMGHALGQPIHCLLGGAHRMAVQPYATGFYRLHGQGEAERLADEARGHADSGFRAMKVKLGFGVADDVAVMEAVAEAVRNRDVELMVDTNHAYGRAEALALGRALERIDRDGVPIRWYEEPVAPEDTEGYAELRRTLSIPIAGGENEHTPFGFHNLFRAGAVDVAQPDIASCGGFTAARDIAAMAHAAGVAVNPHVWGSAIAQAASIQLIAALPVAHHSLHAREPLLEYDRSDHPFRRALVRNPWDVEDGMVRVPPGPGLGIEVDMEAVERFSA